jgi:hypothetical protein
MIDWNKYPEQIPKEKGYYIMYYGTPDKNGVQQVKEFLYNPICDSNEYDNIKEFLEYNKVTYWAKLNFPTGIEIEIKKPIIIKISDL